MKVLDIALIVYDILNEIIAQDDKTIENLMFYRDKLKELIDARIRQDESL